MHVWAYVLTRFYGYKIPARDGKRSGLNTLSMIAKLYVVTYIPLKSQKSAILSLSALEFPANETDEGAPLGGGLALFLGIKRRKSTKGREDTQTPKSPSVGGHDTPL